MSKNSVFIKENTEKKNLTLLFLREITLEKPEQIVANFSAFTYFKVLLNGESVFFGPERRAHGYHTKSCVPLSLKKGRNVIAVIVNYYGVANYSCASGNGFFFADFTVGGRTYGASDFSCHVDASRVQNAQRYSFQRGFCEIYEMERDFKKTCDLLLKEKGEAVKSARLPKEIAPVCPISPLTKVENGVAIRKGKFSENPDLPKWKDRSVEQVGNLFEGFYKNELKECIIDRVSGFETTDTAPIDGGKVGVKKGEFALFDLGRNVSGFLRLKLTVKKDAEIYATFDEMLLKNGEVDAFRLSCGNVVKWSLKKGEYTLETFEPYTLKYMQVYCTGGEAEIENASVKLLENPNAYALSFKIKDEVAERIVKSAQNTLAQNSVDLLTDCPSRERAGWINDIYYSHQAERILSGRGDAFHASIVNYLLDKGLPALPKKMVPMCYPSDHLNGEYIPNCAMWFVLNACDFVRETSDKKWIRLAKKKVYGVIDFFKPFENEDGLLENLKSWIFVEWSAANKKEFVCGVNYPTNMLYAKMLEETGKAFGDEKLIDRAREKKETIREQSFNGEFFEDNRVRKGGALVRTGNVSEACQYFAFFSETATPKRDKPLYETLKNEFGVERDAKKVHPEIDRANIITGLLMRLELLLSEGENERVVREAKEIFSVMAEGTDTLWENTTPHASLNHCVASFGGSCLVRAFSAMKK